MVLLFGRRFVSARVMQTLKGFGIKKSRSEKAEESGAERTSEIEEIEKMTEEQRKGWTTSIAIHHSSIKMQNALGFVLTSPFQNSDYV
jgi:hypothetical protein